jgi:hypothetical protein
MEVYYSVLGRSRGVRVYNDVDVEDSGGYLERSDVFLNPSILPPQLATELLSTALDIGS